MTQAPKPRRTSIIPMGLGRKLLNQVAASPVLDQLKLRKPTERLVTQATAAGFTAIAGLSKGIQQAKILLGPARLAAPSRPALFDLTPTDEQQALRDAAQDFAQQRLRPAALAADSACAAPADLFAEAQALGFAALAVPEAHGGAGAERNAVSHVLITEALAEGKMGLAVACLAPQAVATAAFVLNNVRVPKENLLGSAEVNVEKGFAGVMQTFDNTRPLVAGMALGLTRACLERTRELLAAAGVAVDYQKTPLRQTAAACLLAMEADYESARLLTLQAAWMADNRKPNSRKASMAKAKIGRTCVDVALQCVALCAATGYGEDELLEKWARDAKILDIFEGTQQIQLLIIERRLLGKSSAELK